MREAACSCGQLKIRLEGEPQMVANCACQACQRRTGAAFGVVSIFEEGQVAAREGDVRVFERIGESGNAIRFRFCPNCGSTVWWDTAARPGAVLVAVGAFADRDFPKPQALVWADEAAHWVRPPEGAAVIPRGI